MLVDAAKASFHLLFGVLWFPVLAILSVTFRSAETQRPRVAWGPTPLLPISHNSRALAGAGLVSRTLVDAVYPINDPQDFDLRLDSEFLSWARWVPGLTRFLRFVHFLRHFDVLITNFDGGLLNGTGLRFIEHVFWRLGRKRVVVWPYGSDSFVYSRISDHSLRYGLYRSYPDGARRERHVMRQIEYFTRHADFVVGNIPHNEACPRADVLTVACYGIDTSIWSPAEDFRHCRDGRYESVVVLHCPNHREVKGTRFLLHACEALRAEGLKLDLQIVEGRKHAEMRDLMRNCDVLVAEVLYGYASTEIEGMSLGKPVVSNLESPTYYAVARRYTYLKECPIVSASPETLMDRLRQLVMDPALRERLGEMGRQYVLKYHSMDAQAEFWLAVVRKVCGGSQTDLENWWRRQSANRGDLLRLDRERTPP